MRATDTDVNEFTETIFGSHVETKIQWAKKIRTVLAFRGDEAIDDVTSLTPTSTATALPAPVVNFGRANSGMVSQFMPEPRESLIFARVWTRLRE